MIVPRKFLADGVDKSDAGCYCYPAQFRAWELPCLQSLKPSIRSSPSPSPPSEPMWCCGAASLSTAAPRKAGGGAATASWKRSSGSTPARRPRLCASALKSWRIGSPPTRRATTVAAVAPNSTGARRGASMIPTACLVRTAARAPTSSRSRTTRRAISTANASGVEPRGACAPLSLAPAALSDGYMIVRPKFLSNVVDNAPPLAYTSRRQFRL